MLASCASECVDFIPTPVHATFLLLAAATPACHKMICCFLARHPLALALVIVPGVPLALLVLAAGVSTTLYKRDVGAEPRPLSQDFVTTTAWK